MSPTVVGVCGELARPWLRQPGVCDTAAQTIGAPPGPYLEVQMIDPAVGTTSVTSSGATFSLTLDASFLSFDWTATTPVDLVVAGGPWGGAAYLYAPAATSDTALRTFLSRHVTSATFCWRPPSYALVVSKTAAATFQRTWGWSIEKTSTTSSVSLPVGATADASYVVTVTASPSDSGWAVTGEITIQNPAPVAATGVQIVDSYGGAPATVDCGAFAGTLAAGASLTCAYTVALAAAFDGTNVATVTTTGGVPGGTASAEVTFGAPATTVDDCVSVTDDRMGALGTVCAAAAPATFSYRASVGPYAACDPTGLGTPFVNTASFSAPSGATGSSSWTIAVEVPCTSSGCTLTQGYWKTHSRKGPAPYDARWENLDALEEATPFFLSGKTWYEVFSTPVKGNAYYNLAHQYMAAKLNVLAGASASALGNALTTSEAFFAVSTPSTPLTASQRAALLGLATLLDQFNNGEIGPGHCDNRK